MKFKYTFKYLNPAQNLEVEEKRLGQKWGNRNEREIQERQENKIKQLQKAEEK